MKMQRKGKLMLLASMLASVIVIMYALASGCGIPYETIEVDGMTRRYLLHVPEQLPTDAKVPLVMALHQFSDTPNGMRLMTQLNPLADREGCIVVYPEGRYRIWNADRDPAGRDNRFLLALMDRLVKQYPVDEARIYATGASAGAMMIQALATHTNRLAAIAPVMGSLSESAAAPLPETTHLPVLVIHGVDDPVIPFDGGRAGGPHESHFLSAEETAAFWASANGCEEKPAEETRPVAEGSKETMRILRYACPDDAEVLLYAINDCGHSWPGHKSRYPGCIVGPSTDAPSATDIIWDFFKRHQRKDLQVQE